MAPVYPDEGLRAHRPHSDRARGGFLPYRFRGKKYIDGVSSLWVNIHGHGVPEIDGAIKKQLELVSHSTLLGITNPPAAELAKELVEICPPGLKKVFYSGDGASAVEVALKMAFQYWSHKGRPEKKAFLCLDNGYHGDTLGAVSVGGIDIFHKAFSPLLFKTLQGSFLLLLQVSARGDLARMRDRVRGRDGGDTEGEPR